jgi:hypothetical protein
MMHEDAVCSIFFGDAKHAFIPYEHKGFSALQRPPFNSLAYSMGLSQLVFLHQTHSAHGKAVQNTDTHQPLPSFIHDGDFLLTREPHVGLGVSTADCLPIVIVDTVNKAAGIAHAGWRGSVVGVGTSLLVRMNELFSTRPEQIKVFFGPSARTCCYEVQKDFYEQIHLFPYASQTMVEREGKYYFDLGFFNKMQLELVGVPSEAINQDFYLCTMCNDEFCSYRRQQNNIRQMTVVSIK